MKGEISFLANRKTPKEKQHRKSVLSRVVNYELIPAPEEGCTEIHFSNGSVYLIENEYVKYLEGEEFPYYGAEVRWKKAPGNFATMLGFIRQCFILSGDTTKYTRPNRRTMDLRKFIFYDPTWELEEKNLVLLTFTNTEYPIIPRHAIHTPYISTDWLPALSFGYVRNINNLSRSPQFILTEDGADYLRYPKTVKRLSISGSIKNKLMTRGRYDQE